MRRTRYLFGFALIVGAFIYLSLTAFRSSLQYYVTVSELAAEEGRYQDKILKVAGRAFEIQKKEEKEGLVYFFSVREGGDTLPVVYHGLVPDTFKEGSEVVVTGNLEPDGILKANHILAKCASKYEAKIE